MRVCLVQKGSNTFPTYVCQGYTIYRFPALSTQPDLFLYFSKHPQFPQMTCDLPAMCPCAQMLTNTQSSGEDSCPAACELPRRGSSSPAPVGAALASVLVDARLKHRRGVVEVRHCTPQTRGFDMTWELTLVSKFFSSCFFNPCHKHLSETIVFKGFVD